MLRNLFVQFLKIFLASSCIVFFNCTMIKSSSKDKTPEFKIELSGGSLVPGEINSTVLVFSDSISSCTKYLPSSPAEDESETYEFRLNEGQRKSLWKAIEENDFFQLKNEYVSNETIDDGYYYSIVIRTSTIEKQTMVQNYDLLNTATIINEINLLLPEAFKFEF